MNIVAHAREACMVAPLATQDAAGETAIAAALLSQKWVRNSNDATRKLWNGANSEVDRPTAREVDGMIAESMMDGKHVACIAAEPFVRSVPFLRRNAKLVEKHLQLGSDGRKLVTIIRKRYLEEVATSALRLEKRLQYAEFESRSHARDNVAQRWDFATLQYSLKSETLQRVALRHYEWVETPQGPTHAGAEASGGVDFTLFDFDADFGVVTDWTGNPIGTTNATFLPPSLERREGPYSLLVSADSAVLQIRPYRPNQCKM
jgi:hypothetical protein